MAEDRGEAVRLAGTVVEVSDPPFGSTTVTIEGDRFGRDESGWLVVDVEGRRVRIDAEGAKAVGDATTEASGAWRELRDRTKLSPEIAPPFKPAKLVAIEPAVGDRVEIYGEVAERGFDDDGAYRDAPSTSLKRVRASVVARGDKAADTLTRALATLHPPKTRATKRRDPRRDDPGSPMNRPPAGEYVVSAGFAAAAVFTLATWGVASEPVAIGFAACAVVTRPMRTERSFRARADKDPTTWSSLDTIFAMLYAGTLLGLVGVVGFGPLRYVTLTFVAILWGLEVRAWHALGTHRRLLAAKPWTGRLGGTWLVEGVVRDPTPVTVGDTERAAIGRTTEYDKGIGSNPDTIKWTRFHADGTFLVDAKAGVVEIDPDELVWASTVVEAPLKSYGDYQVSELIPVGGNVAAVGTIVAGPDGGPPRLVANGTTPAVLFATSSRGEPLGLAVAMLLHHQITVAVITALLALAVGICTLWT